MTEQEIFALLDKLDRLGREPGDEYWEMRDDLLARADTDALLAFHARQAGYPC